MAAAPIAFPLLILCAALVLLGLQKGWQASFGRLFYALAASIALLPTLVILNRHIGFGGIANAIRAASDSIYNWLGQAVAFMTAPFSMFVRYMAQVLEAPALQAQLLAADVLHALTVLRRTLVPQMIASKVAWIPRHLARLEAQVASLVARAPVHIVHNIEHVVAKTTQVVVTKAVAIPFPRIGRLEREGEALSKRIDRLARRVAPAAIVAAVVVALSKVGAGFVRCAKVKKVGRQVCGMDNDLLDSLLADTLLVVGTISLVEFAEGLQAGMDDLTPQVRRFWNVK